MELLFKEKSELGKTMYNMIKNLSKNCDVKVKLMQCDNAGENVKFQKKVEEQGLGLRFEFTAPYVPQQNGTVEQSFATSFGRVRAILNQAGIKNELRYDLWTECANVETDICNTSVSEANEKSAYKKTVFKKNPRYTNNLRIFGKVGILFNTYKKEENWIIKANYLYL